jgi:G3E family GTPase
VVLNKCDLVDDTQRTEVRAWVRQIVPRARLAEAVHAEVPLELLLGVGRFRLELMPMAAPAHVHVHDETCNHDHDHEHHDHHDHHHDHSQAFSTWSYSSDQPFELKRLRQVITRMPISIFRAKGLLLLAEAPERRAVFQAVGRRVSLTLGEPWGQLPPRTQLVCIAEPGGIDGPALQAQFDGCLAEVVEPELVSDQQWLREGT